VPAKQHNVADILWKSPGSDIEVIELHMDDEISDLYRINVRIRSKTKGMAFSSMLKEEAEIVIKCGEDLEKERVLTGIITRFAQARTSFGDVDTTTNKTYFYDVEIRPKFWLAKKVITTKIYKQMSVKDIVEYALGELGINMEWSGSNGTQVREYTVQYAESVFDFVSRLIEDEGVSYSHDHEGRRVKFASDNSGFDDCKPMSEVNYCEDITPHMPYGRDEIISDFAFEQVIASGEFKQRQYRYDNHATKKEQQESKSTVPAFSDLKVFEHDENFEKYDNASDFAKIRLEEEFASAHRGHGESTCRAIEAGHTFTMKEHYLDDLNKKWLVTKCALSGEQGRVRVYFDCIPVDVPYRPERKTPKPRIYGVHTATIVGSGSDFSIDESGRCQIAFHWDGDKTETLWARIANNYAGKDYGIQWVPRIGHEVLVSFVGGDPDRPVITNRVYNDVNTPPLQPAKKTQNIIKTIKDNHIMFDDKDGEELVDIRAEKDMNVLVATGDQTVTVEKGDQTFIVTKGKRVHKVKKNEDITIEGNQTTTVTKNISIESKSGKIHVKSPQKITLECGSSSITMSPAQIEIKCGGSKITLNPAMIEEKAPLIKLN